MKLILPKTRTRRGVTLAEMLIVVAVLALLAGAAILSLSPAQPVALNSAAADVLAALRFARLEARRTRMPTMVAIDPQSKTLQVSRLDFTAGVAVRMPVSHPLHRLDYEIRLDRFAGGRATKVQSVFAFSDGTLDSAIGFLPHGEPGKVTSATTVQPLKDADRWRGAWQADFMYRLGELVTHGAGDYAATLEHFAGTDFGTDLANGMWSRNDLAAPQITLEAGAEIRRIHVAPITGLVRVQQ